jgi:D-erythronate 2-dehydrogenase
MRVVVTGAAGFLGREVVAALLRRGELRGRELRRVVAVDVAAPPEVPGHRDDPRVTAVAGDITEPGFLASVLDPGPDVVFHLAAVVSGQAEAEYDTGMRVNLDGTRLLLDACRATGRAPVVVFASSLAVYGGALPATVDDTTALHPATSYGTQKAVGELLLADATRRGFLDGRALRLPTVCVRPGRPNRAASSFLSGIVREPVAGVAAVCPVAPGTAVWLTSPRSAVAGLVAGAELDSGAIGADRSVNLPGVSVTVGEMVATLGRLAGPAAADLVRWERDPQIERIVGSWPAAVDTGRAAALGLPGDPDFAALVEAHLHRATGA